MDFSTLPDIFFGMKRVGLPLIEFSILIQTSPDHPNLESLHKSKLQEQDCDIQCYLESQNEQHHLSVIRVSKMQLHTASNL